MLEMKFKRLSDTMVVPTKAHDTDACFDIYADALSFVDTYGFSDNGEIYIFPHETVIIPTGFATNIPNGYWRLSSLVADWLLSKGFVPQTVWL